MGFNVLMGQRTVFLFLCPEKLPPGADETGDHDRKPKDMLKDSIQGCVCATKGSAQKSKLSL